MKDVTRRRFLAGGAAAGAASIAGFGTGWLSPASADPAPSRFHAEFPSHDPADVRTVVAKAHVDFDTVKSLVEARPALAKSALDWGFGDWESALGAAAHMGRRDIAEILLRHARSGTPISW